MVLAVVFFSSSTVVPPVCANPKIRFKLILCTEPCRSWVAVVDYNKLLGIAARKSSIKVGEQDIHSGSVLALLLNSTDPRTSHSKKVRFVELVRIYQFYDR